MDTKDQRQIQAWKASADLAEIRNEPVRAWLLRTMAYELEFGRLSLAADRASQDTMVRESETADV